MTLVVHSVSDSISVSVSVLQYMFGLDDVDEKPLRFSKDISFGEKIKMPLAKANQTLTKDLMEKMILVCFSPYRLSKHSDVSKVKSVIYHVMGRLLREFSDTVLPKQNMTNL